MGKTNRRSRICFRPVGTGSTRPARGAPTVSICVPTFNSEATIVETLRSALAQTYADFELLVVDDGSSDATVELARRARDDRLRVVACTTNLGQAGNTNRCLGLARGRLVKFLHSDDLLLPECLERMVPLFERHAALGLAFAPRRLEGASDEWRALYGETHAGFDDLREVNAGDRLLGQWVRAGLPHNWVGEPTSVMMRRACFERIGGLNPHLRQDVDMELWLRTLAFFDVGFVDAPLSVYRREGGDSVTATNLSGGRAWLDRLWMLEGLRAHDEIWRR